MKAIITKYLPATETKGSRIKAKAGNLTATVSYNYALSDHTLHFEAVKELVKKHNLDWNISQMTYGGTDTGYCFTFANSIV